MTDHYAAYIALLANRDETVIKLIVLSLASVVTWYGFRLVPERFRNALKTAYLAGGALLAVGLIWIQH